MDHGLYKILPSKFHALTLRNKNKHKSWEYGYNKEHDIVIISRDGTLGEVYDINGLKIGLPAEPKKIPKKNNIWEASQYPKELSRIKTVFEWNKRDNKFKDLCYAQKLFHELRPWPKFRFLRHIWSQF